MTKDKYLIQTAPKDGLYRLTLTAEAFALAVTYSEGAIAGYAAYPRKDGKWDVMVHPAIAEELDKQKQGDEHKWDVVVRVLKSGEAQAEAMLQKLLAKPQ